MLELHCPHHLTELCPKRAFLPWLEQARYLHGERRSAGDDASASDHLSASAQQRAQIDPAMLRETCVLVGRQHGKIARVDIRDLDRQAPASLRSRERSQQATLPINHDRRAGIGHAEVERSDLLRDAPGRKAREHQQAESGSSRGTDAATAPVRCRGCVGHGLACTTSTDPKSVRPNRSGLYMSSTCAAGWT